MRKTALLLGIGLFVSTGAAGADLSSVTKSYFAKTKPGTYAKWEQTTTDPKGKTSASR